MLISKKRSLFTFVIIFFAFVITGLKPALAELDPLEEMFKPRWLPEERAPSQDELSKMTLEQDLLKPVDVDEISSHPFSGKWSEFREGLSRHLSWCKARKRGRNWRLGKRIFSFNDYCTETAKVLFQESQSSKGFKDFWARVKDKFYWYRSNGPKKDWKSFFTGYYIPLLHGKTQKTLSYHYPLYEKPSDLHRIFLDGTWRWRRMLPSENLALYPDRKKIDWKNFLEGKNHEIVYVDDPIEAFFLHIQGSGQVAIKDNNGNLLKNIWVNYRAQNGRPYVAIGKILKEEGVDRSYLTLQGLRRYFRERPEEMDRIFPMNPSYIFFRKADEGPFGSTGFRLIAGHSAALDNRYYPSGVFGLTQYMQPEKVDQEVDHWEEKSRFVFHHDSGGAIKGPGRMDVFWGSGDFAETAAGGSAHYGDLFFGIVR